MEISPKDFDFSKIDINKLENDKKIIAIAGAVSFIGTLLPWASLPIIGGQNGIDLGVGWLVILASLVIIAASLEGKAEAKLSKRNTIAALIAAGLNLLLLLLKFMDIMNAKSHSRGIPDLFEIKGVSFGLGFWITTLATLATGAFLFKALTGRDLIKEASQKASKLKNKAEDKIEDLKKDKKEEEK